MGWFSEEVVNNVNTTDHVSAGALVMIAICVLFVIIGRLIAQHMRRTAAESATREVRLSTIAVRHQDNVL